MAKSKLSQADIETIRYLHGLGVSRRKIAELHFKGRISRTTVGHVIDFGKVPSKSDLIALKQASLTQGQSPDCQVNARDLDQEIDHYSPCLASSFNSGRGSMTPQSVINKTVKQNSDCRDFIQFRQAKFTLLSLLNEKKLDPTGNRFRELLKKRVLTLGFDASSDNDIQFGQLNDMAAVGLAVIRAVGEKANALNLARLVDAAIVYRRPDWRRRLEESTRRLRCARCRKSRSFIKGKDGKTVTCLSCGLETPLEKAKFRISVRRLDPEYVDLVHSVVASKSCGLGFVVEPGPLTSPRQASNPKGNLENANSQDSKQMLETET